jgi:hypothetical protein
LGLYDSQGLPIHHVQLIWGRGEEDPTNFGLPPSSLENCEYLVVVHGAIYRDNDPANDPRPRSTSLAHGKHVRKEHSEVEVRCE